MSYDAEKPARTELQRAYLLVRWGRLEEGLEACDRAAELAPDAPLPPTIAGAFCSSFGRHSDAVKRLRSVTRAHPDFSLAHLYFAEASFLLGRLRPARRSLQKARSCDDIDANTEFLEGLSELIEKRPELEPLVVPL